jgi:acetyl-CoA C-acetyltransferase
VNRSADDLAAGRRRAVLIAGGEALHTLRLASKRRVELAWSQGRGRAATIGDDRQGSHPDEWRYGLQMPTQIYPLFEVALRAHEERDPAPHGTHLARLAASFAAVAATHPEAWFRDGKSAAEIGTLTPVNRMIAYPYPKFMTSILEVDQAAAVIMTTVGEARALGIPPSRWIYVHGGGEANDLWYVKDRVDFHSSPGMAEAFRQAIGQARVEPHDVDFLDLYSCFPVAPQIAARLLGVPSDGTRPLTVTGGLPYFGGAGNNYALHAIATMVERLRRAPAPVGWCRRWLVLHQARRRDLWRGRPDRRGRATASRSASGRSMICPSLVHRHVRGPRYHRDLHRAARAGRLHDAGARRGAMRRRPADACDHRGCRRARDART